MSNLIIIPKKNGYLVRNQNNNKEMAIFKTKQDAQVFIKNYKAGKLSGHSHESNGHTHTHTHGNSMPFHSQQYSSMYPNMMYPPQMQGQMYSNMMYPPQMQGQMYSNMMYPPQMQGQMYPNMMYPPQMQGQMYPNMMYPPQFPGQSYNQNMMMGYGMNNNMPYSTMNQTCECGYVYNNEYEGEIEEEEDFLDFETNSPELIKPPEIGEMNKTLEEQKNENESSKTNEPVKQIQNDEQIVPPIVVEQITPVVNVEPIVAKEPTMVLSDLTNFSIEDANEMNNTVSTSVGQESIDTTNLSKKELKKLKKQQKQELKLIKKQEKRNKHIYDEMEDYDF